MIFQSQLRRVAILNWTLLCIPDIIMAAGISFFMDGGLVGFLLAFAALFAIGLVGYILRSIVMWLAWSSSGKQTAEERIFHYLVENKFPKPAHFELSPQDYFARVAQDEHLPADVRVKAAVEVGTYAAYVGALEKQALAKVNGAAENALERYSRSFAA